MSNRHPHFEEDNTTWPDEGYRVKGFEGIACYVRGWETEPDEDTEWSGIEVRTGRVIVTMVGDDQRFKVDPEDITPLKRSEYCGGCGQIGCKCDAYPEDDN